MSHAEVAESTEAHSLRLCLPSGCPIRAPATYASRSLRPLRETKLLSRDDIPAIVIVQRVATGGGYHETVAMDAGIGNVDEPPLTGKVVVGMLVGGGNVVDGLYAIVPLQAGERVVEPSADGSPPMRIGHDASVGQGSADDERVGIDLGEALRTNECVAREAVTYACERGGVVGHRGGEGFELAPQRPRVLRIAGTTAKQAQQHCADEADGGV